MLNTSTFTEFIAAHQLIKKTDQVLVAVSGGLDSMVLCHLLHTNGYSIGIAHVNFQLRGTASDSDQQFVAQHAAALNIRFYTTTFDTKSIATHVKTGIEETARNLRYNWLQEIAALNDYSLIATAHHANDNAETLLIHLTRGSGLNGLTGIPVQHHNIVRPLLFALRSDIETYATEHNIAYKTDSTNSDETIRRNYFRHTVLPELHKINPNIISTLHDTAVRLTESAFLAQQQTERILRKLCRHVGADVYLPVAGLKKHPAARTLLFAWLQPYGFNTEQCTNILLQSGTSGKQFMSSTNRVLCIGKHLVLTTLDQQQIQPVFFDKDQKHTDCGLFTLECSIIPAHIGIPGKTDHRVAYFDADKINAQLLCRKWQNGDYCYPLGLNKKHSQKPGKKKVSDILTDAKVHLLDKERTCVICSGDHIIWIPGIRQDGRFAVTGKTKHILKIKMLSK